MTGAERDAQQVYAELLERVGEAHPRPRIEPVRRLAELVGSPQLSFAVVHVAGTNGKTSTSRAIESLLRAHGLHTGLFTSPHLVSFTERFQLDGEPVTGHVLAEAWQELKVALEVVDAELAASGQSPITFFEALAVLAFEVFADAPVDVAVVEVGMGGEWDATNIVNADVAVFTPIDLDHMAILGSDIATIARTKAGIISQGCTVVSAQQSKDALVELAIAAEREHAKLFVADRDFRLLDDVLAVGGRQVHMQGLHSHIYDPTFVAAHGSHQAENVLLAVAAVEAFFGGERPIPGEVLEDALAQFTSPGRLQLLSNDPIVYVDAAHNPHGAEALARAVTESFQFSDIAVLFGAMADKDANGTLEALTPIASRVVLSPINTERSLSVDQLRHLANSVESEAPVTVSNSLHEALDELRAWASEQPGRAVLVAGSVVLAGDTIAHARADGWAIS